MADIARLTDAMLGAAATVLGRLVEQPVAAAAAQRRDQEGSVKIDPDTLVTTAVIPSLGVTVVAGFTSSEMSRVVALMLGGADDGGEMGAMQLSIVSETVSQIAGAMAEELARCLGTSTDGVRAELCTDATNLPAPPFVSYEGIVAVGDDVAPRIAIHFDGIAASKIESAGTARMVQPAPVAAPAAPASPPAPPRAAPSSRPAAPSASAAPVAFTQMAPTPQRGQSQNGLDMVHDVPLQISAVLGKTALTLRDVVGLQSGSVFELDKLSSDPIDLYVNNILIARGEVVVVDDKFAVKISELNPVVE